MGRKNAKGKPGYSVLLRDLKPYRVGSAVSA
jgi:hypothetical protein